jgi:hypothetical protein
LLRRHELLECDLLNHLAHARVIGRDWARRGGGHRDVLCCSGESDLSARNTQHRVWCCEFFCRLLGGVGVSSSSPCASLSWKERTEAVSVPRCQLCRNSSSQAN